MIIKNYFPKAIKKSNLTDSRSTVVERGEKSEETNTMIRTKETKSPQTCKTEQYIAVREGWPLRRGKKELLRHLKDEEITCREAIIAKCYECMGGYDEVGDCNVPKCPLYPWMPYRHGGPRKRAMSEDTRKANTERLQGARARRKQSLSGEVV
jgi:hypothetical protein